MAVDPNDYSVGPPRDGIPNCDRIEPATSVAAEATTALHEAAPLIQEVAASPSVVEELASQGKQIDAGAVTTALEETEPAAAPPDPIYKFTPVFQQASEDLVEAPVFHGELVARDQADGFAEPQEPASEAPLSVQTLRQAVENLTGLNALPFAGTEKQETQPGAAVPRELGAPAASDQADGVAEDPKLSVEHPVAVEPGDEIPPSRITDELERKLAHHGITGPR
jgi:hypothetical protein